MSSRRLVSSILLTLAIAACAPAPVGPSLGNDSAPAGQSANASRIAVQIDTGAVLTTLAAKKTAADIDHYHLKLVDANTGVVIAEGDSHNATSHFDNVPNGTYLLKADAIDANGNSIVQGGEQTSVNTVTVNSPTITYSDGSPCLKVTLRLLDATGEAIGNKVHVIDGQDWTGPANLVDGGDCPCNTCFGVAGAQIDHVYTVAGGLGGVDGDLATTVRIGNAGGITHDAAGNLYISDTLEGRVWMVPRTDGIYFDRAMQAQHIYDIAGTGVPGYSPDGTLARTAQLNNPAHLTVDYQGNLFIPETESLRIRMIPRSDGTYFGQTMLANHIYTVAGNGQPGGGDDTPATSAGIWHPQGVATDAQGNVYYTVYNDTRLQMVPRVPGVYFGRPMQVGYTYTIAGGNATTTDPSDGGPATAGVFFYSTGIAIDSAGDVYFSDRYHSRVRVISAIDGSLFGQPVQANHIYTVAGRGGVDLNDASGYQYDGDGQLATASGVGPNGISLDAQGNLYIADDANKRMRMVPKVSGTYFGQTMQANHLYTLAGGGTDPSEGILGQNALFGKASGITVDANGNVFLATWYNGVRMLARNTCQ